MVFINTNDDLIIHSITLRPDDVIEISYTQKRFMLDWGYKTETWSFDRSIVPDIELEQLIDSIDMLIGFAEVKQRQDAE